MKKSGLFIFLVLLLSCPLLAKEKTYDPIFDDAVFDHPGFDLGQVAWGSMNYQKVASGSLNYQQVASGSLNYQRYGPSDCGSQAEGYWEPDPANYKYGK